MGHYIEIRLLPDPEFSASVLMNALFAKFHRALVDIGQREVGVSFPQAKKTLGDKLRLHGSRSALQRLMDLSWLKGLTDYTSVSAITPVPDNCRYRVVKRVQAKSSVERIYRRSVMKGWLTIDEAEAKVNEKKEHQLKQPFVQLKSNSSGQSFRLFIQQGELLDSPVAGAFSDYGLSGVATIPWF
jgi:CRISPR-associated endonuclease Csy4